MDCLLVGRVPWSIALVSNLLVSVLVAPLAIRAAIVDWREHRLPNKLTAAIALITVPGCWTAREQWLAVWCAVVLAHLLLVILPPHAVGAGDLKLVAGLVPLIGQATSWWLLVSYAVAALQGLVAGRRKGRIPLGPALVGVWIAGVMGDFAHVALAYRR